MPKHRRKKLIEVALPLAAINEAAQRENNIHTGLPANLHAWWSRKPIGVARSVLFASLVDDPEEYLEPEQAEAKREHLFSVVSRLADVANSDDKSLLADAKKHILESNGGLMPEFLDPFCGGGSLPLEALRLGLPSTGSDLNPVAVFITRVLISLAPKHARHAPINPDSRASYLPSGAKFEGVKADVEYYASKIEERLRSRIGASYPPAKGAAKAAGNGQVVAWIWARTVVCPNPSCRAVAPLVNKFWLSTHKGNKAYAVPKYQSTSRRFSYEIGKSGEPQDGTVSRSGAKCAACENPITFDYIRAEGMASRIGYDLMAMAVEGNAGRLYVEATAEQLEAAQSCTPDWEPDTELPSSALGFRVQKYGITQHRDLFTKRQMMMLSALSDEIRNIRSEIIKDSNGDGDYANLIQAMLALSLSRVAQTNNSLVRWLVRASGTSKGTPAFDRQIVSMTWEFSEGNVFSSSVGSWKAAIRNPLTALNSVPDTDIPGRAIQHNASDLLDRVARVVVSTDPPYFDAIGYADLSDFFYIWLRKAIGAQHADIFGTMLVPKVGDLTRDLGRREVPKGDATEGFLTRLHAAFQSIRSIVTPEVPLTVYYAFKQAESEAGADDDGEVSTYSTGWETLLEGLFQSGLQITGTWPLRTEGSTRLRAIGSNALASSIILVCRPRSEGAPNATRREFVAALRSELPAALRHLQAGNIAPVDLAQAAIGPGMGVYTRYANVLDAEGKPVSVREALALINATLDEALAEQEGDFDADSRWALAWFEQNGFDEGEYGVAETLSKAKNTSVAGLAISGILESKRGKVRLLKPEELPASWDPATDPRLTSWEVVHHLIRVLGSGGESAAAELVAKLGARAETARELAYRLYTICERKKRAAEALAYNGLVQSWPEIVRLAQEGGKRATAEPDLFNAGER